MMRKTDIPFNMIYLGVFILFGVVLSVSSESSICTMLESFNNHNGVIKSRWEREFVKVAFLRRWITYSEIQTFMDTKTEHYCCPGYEKISESNTPLLCSPICNPKCKNGTCVRPGTCKCYDGYEPDESSAYECVPHCEGGCINGKCIDVDHCSCLEGYKAFNNSACEPKCSSGCTHGRCTAPEVCTCDHGYKKTSQYSCEPICDMECIGGTCSGVNECTCSEGYAKNEKLWNVCDPQCDSCVNAYCSEPNQCTCINRYEKNASNPNICNPICHPLCVNGFCSSPDTCECNEGFWRSYYEINTCIPKCDHHCHNGECTAPNVCTCENGYEFVNEMCTPVCEYNCVNSVCTSPNYCECHMGAVKINNSVCANLCGENRTVDCWNSIQNVQEHSSNIGESGFEVITVPKERYVITVDTSCQKFVSNGDQESEANFACSADKTANGIDTFCQRGNYNITDTSEFFNFTGLYKNNSFENEKLVNVNFTFIFPIDHPSSENCRLCFCDTFNIEIDLGLSSITLCPCQDNLKDLRGLQPGVITVICLSILVLLLSVSGVILYYIRNRLQSGVYRLDNSPLVPDAVAEENL